jgi:hypothetical protein
MTGVRTDPVDDVSAPPSMVSRAPRPRHPAPEGADLPADAPSRHSPRHAPRHSLQEADPVAPRT